MIFRIIRKELKYLFWAIMIFPFIFGPIYLFGGKYVGALEAKYDLWKGHYELRYIGFQINFVVQVRTKVLNAYGIAYRRAAGHRINIFIRDRVAAYNRAMEASIRENLGLCVDCLLFMKSENECKDKPNGPLLLMETLIPKDLGENLYTIGDCFESFNADVDGDKIKEKICMRYLNYKISDDIHTYVSLIVDLFKNKKQVLRQELDRKFFFEERFIDLMDVNGDGKMELITKVRFSPDCSGCEDYRVYTFNKDRFALTLNLFNIKPDNPHLMILLGMLSGLEDMILKDHREKSKSQHPCEIWNSRVSSDPWAVDVDYDGQPEVVILLMPGSDGDFFNDKIHYLLIAKFTKTGELKSYKIHRIDFECCLRYWSVDVLGFLETCDKHKHLLINYVYPGNSLLNPALKIFDIHWPHVNNIGEFTGFYENKIASRIRDINGNGNAEIIYIEDTFWPHGKSHMYIMPIYGIAEYREGRYVNANEKFKKDIERLNDFNN